MFWAMKEEYEGERLQVESLLSRSEELILTLQVFCGWAFQDFTACSRAPQVINQLRVEISHVLKDISDAKKNHKEVSTLLCHGNCLSRLLKLVLVITMHVGIKDTSCLSILSIISLLLSMHNFRARYQSKLCIVCALEQFDAMLLSTAGQLTLQTASVA